MKFSIVREALLKPLQLVAGVVEKRQTMPALANVLIVLEKGVLSLTGTDTEVEIIGRVALDDANVSSAVDGEVTAPAKKLLDICRSLPDGSELQFSFGDTKATVKCGRSRFTLSTLPASEFPVVESSPGDLGFDIPQADAKRLIEKTSFAMGQQDVRYYLNGMLWELHDEQIRVVATDGHRLAMCSRPLEIDVGGKVRQAILPRKGVTEFSKLLSQPEEIVQVTLGTNHMRAETKDFVFTSKLIDAQYPDYQRVIPSGGDKIIVGNRNELKQGFSRASILSNEKYRGVSFVVNQGMLEITANNPEQEEAQEQVVVDYNGDQIEVGFNVSYLLDVANVLDSEMIKITMASNSSSALIEEPVDGDCLYVVMPMRL